MSVQTFPIRTPEDCSKYLFSWGRLDLLSGYQILPSESSFAIVSCEYRHPSGGDGKPFHSYIMFGRGLGLVILSSLYRPLSSL